MPTHGLLRAGGLADSIAVELRHLRYFIEVAETLNFSRAAERLKVAQPALSKQIRDLEDELGVRLFHRSTAKVALTEVGHYFRQEARRLLLHLDIAVTGAQQLTRGAIGTLRVGCDWQFPRLRLAAAIARFHKAHPRIAIQLQEINGLVHVAAIRDLTIDVGFALSPSLGETQDLDIRPLFKVKIQVALPASHRLASHPVIKLRELQDERWLTLNAESLPGIRSIVSDFLKFKPKYGVSAMSLPGVIANVAAGHGIGLLAEGSVPNTDSAVVIADTDRDPITLYAVSLASPASLVTGIFMDILVEMSQLNG